MLSFASVYHTKTSQAHSLSRQWQVLQIFNLYRLGLCIILYTVHSYQMGYLTTTITQPLLFTSVVLGYGLLSVVSIVCGQYKANHFNLHAHSLVIIDVLVIALLTYISGGVGSGLGILLNITIVATGILLSGRQSLLTAALASIAMLFQEGLVAFEQPLYYSQFLQVGVLGGSYFAVAILAKVLLSRLAASEALLNQRSTDLMSMAQLNQCIIERLYSGVVVVDRQMNIRMMNKAAGQLLNVSAKRGNKTLFELSPQIASQLMSWIMQPQQPQSHLFAALSGPEVMADFTIVHESSGDVIILFLEDAGRTAQQAQQMKLVSLGRFTASMAHEIRNPLGAIAHAAQLLAEAPRLTTEDGRLIQIIGDQVERVNVVIKNILQLSRRKKSSAHEINLYTWLQDFIEAFKSSQPRDITIDVQVASEDTSLKVCVDPAQLDQVLTNLCENALIHGNKGDAETDIHFLIKRHPQTSAPMLEVHDQGEPISSEVLAKIFEPFFTTNRTGTGLGLYIAKELCEANHARLDYVSDKSAQGYFKITFYEVKYYAKTECIDC